MYHARCDVPGVHDVRGDDGDAYLGDPVQAACDLVYRSGEWDVALAGLSRGVVDFQSLLVVLLMARRKALKRQKPQSWKKAPIRQSLEWFPERMAHHRTRVSPVP